MSLFTSRLERRQKPLVAGPRSSSYSCTHRPLLPVCRADVVHAMRCDDCMSPAYLRKGLERHLRTGLDWTGPLRETCFMPPSRKKLPRLVNATTPSSRVAGYPILPMWTAHLIRAWAIAHVHSGQSTDLKERPGSSDGPQSLGRSSEVRDKQAHLGLRLEHRAGFSLDSISNDFRDSWETRKRSNQKGVSTADARATPKPS
jgi:hypothetical protein